MNIENYLIEVSLIKEDYKEAESLYSSMKEKIHADYRVIYQINAI